MEFGKYLQMIRTKEKEIWGYTTLKRVDIISIARQAVAKNKTQDHAWLLEKIQTYVLNKTKEDIRSNNSPLHSVSNNRN